MWLCHALAVCCVPGLLRLYGSEAVQLATAARLAPLARSQGLHVLQLSGVRHVLRSYEAEAVIYAPL